MQIIILASMDNIVSSLFIAWLYFEYEKFGRKYKKYILIILLLHIFWVIRYHRDCCLEFYRIDEK